jgi:hypothetical protein
LIVRGLEKEAYQSPIFNRVFANGTRKQSILKTMKREEFSKCWERTKMHLSPAT